MQLFVCDFELNDNKIILTDYDVFYQLRKVLRIKVGDTFFIQKKELTDFRYEICIESRDDKKLIGKILNKEKNQDKNTMSFSMIICMPNKRSKAEIIVQKLSEIGINKIIFWPSERSIIRDGNKNKIDRLNKIAKEAVEQSWGWNLPEIEFTYNIYNYIVDGCLIVFDKFVKSNNDINNEYKNICGLVGPEGGLTEKDYSKLGNNFKIISLGNTILRMETASIIGAWNIKNIKI